MYKPDQINKLSLSDTIKELDNIYRMALYDQTVSGLSNREVEIVKDYQRNLSKRFQKVNRFPFTWIMHIKQRLTH